MNSGEGDSTRSTQSSRDETRRRAPSGGPRTLMSSAPPQPGRAASAPMPSAAASAFHNPCPLCGVGAFPTVVHYPGHPSIKLCGACDFAWRPARPSPRCSKKKCLRHLLPMTIERRFAVFVYACTGSCGTTIGLLKHDSNGKQ